MAEVCGRESSFPSEIHTLSKGIAAKHKFHKGIAAVHMLGDFSSGRTSALSVCLLRELRELLL